MISVPLMPTSSSKGVSVMEVQFILCSLTILCSFNNYSPLLAMQLNVKPESTFLLSNSNQSFVVKKMYVKHTELLYKQQR